MISSATTQMGPRAWAMLGGVTLALLGAAALIAGADPSDLLSPLGVSRDGFHAW